jgi:hypothetical protein
VGRLLNERVSRRFLAQKLGRDDGGFERLRKGCLPVHARDSGDQGNMYNCDDSRR